jgi:hypothetical protein
MSTVCDHPRIGRPSLASQARIGFAPLGPAPVAQDPVGVTAALEAAASPADAYAGIVDACSGLPAPGGAKGTGESTRSWNDWPTGTVPRR